jgi:hypothetical protein
MSEWHWPYPLTPRERHAPGGHRCDLDELCPSVRYDKAILVGNGHTSVPPAAGWAPDPPGSRPSDRAAGAAVCGLAGLLPAAGRQAGGHLPAAAGFARALIRHLGCNALGMFTDSGSRRRASGGALPGSIAADCLCALGQGFPDCSARCRMGGRGERFRR